MKIEEIREFVDKMRGDDINMLLKIYTEECYKEMIEMGFDSSYEEFVEEWKCSIDDVL